MAEEMSARLVCVHFDGGLQPQPMVKPCYPKSVVPEHGPQVKAVRGGTPQSDMGYK